MAIAIFVALSLVFVVGVPWAIYTEWKALNTDDNSQEHSREAIDKMLGGNENNE